MRHSTLYRIVRISQLAELFFPDICIDVFMVRSMVPIFFFHNTRKDSIFFIAYFLNLGFSLPL